MEYKFFMPMDPPTATAQEKQVRIVSGRPMFYEKAAAKEAKQILMAALRDHVPEAPIEGPVRLTVLWMFPHGKSHKPKEWRITKPDTDNLQKGLKDCMTKLGFWKDDAQVVCETVGKLWAEDPAGIVIQIDHLGKFMEDDT